MDPVLAASLFAVTLFLGMLLLPALNQMIDITTTRTMAAQTHPPTVIFAMLAGLALVSALLAGYGMAGGTTRSWIHMLGVAAIMAVTVYVILDIEFPRLRLIRVDAFDQALVELRQNAMNVRRTYGALAKLTIELSPGTAATVQLLPVDE